MKKLFVCTIGLATFLAACNNEPAATETKSADTTSKPAVVNDVTKNWKIGTQMWTFRMVSLQEGLDKADSAGVKYIEAFFGQPVFPKSKEKFGTEMSPETKEKLKQLLQAKGIQIVAMGVISPKNQKEWTKAFDLAKEFGLSYITCEPIKNQWDMIDTMASRYNIKLAIHDHPRPNEYWSPDSVLAAIKGHSNIGSCADVGHWSRNGLNPVDCLKKLEGHVYGVHLKDIVKFDDTQAADTVVSKGVIDFPAIFAELKRQGFEGMFSIEQESNWYHNVGDVKNTVQYFHDQVAKLK
jgi:sugar phosphate isomerase/epimerase